jgi:hypothetical protein
VHDPVQVKGDRAADNGLREVPPVPTVAAAVIARRALAVPQRGQACASSARLMGTNRSKRSAQDGQ